MRRILTLIATLLTLTAVAVPAVQLASVTAANAVEPGSMSAEVSSSWQSNATVWKMAYGNGDIWMVGDFTSLRPPGDPLGTGEQPADYFAALKASTGAPDPAIDDTHIFSGQSSGLPLTNGAVAVSPDGSTVYVGGSFTTVDGLSRNHIAAFSTSTGALLSWNPNVSGKVSAIATFGNVVYVGGSFAKVGKTTVGTNFAAINATTGAAMSWGTGTTPSFDNTVDALAVSSDGSQVVAGGYFSNVDGLSQSADGTTVYNKAAIIGGVTSSTPGALEPMPADAVAVPPGTDAAPVNGCTSDVKFATISGGVAYIADEGTGGGCFDGVWAVNLSDGSLKWVNRCLGATQVLAVIGNYVYKGSHAHDCQENNTNGPVSDDPANFPQVDTNHARHLLSLNTSNGFLGPWYPFSNAGPNLGPRAMATDGTQLYVGGDFTTMNYVGQQGIARFTTTNDYPTPKPAQPVAVASGPGSINVYAQAPVDLDDVDLTMELFRDGGTTPIASQNVTSYFWQQPVVGFTDSGLQLGSQHTYKVEAVETYGTGSSPMSVASAPVTVSNGSTGYAATVLSQNPVGYWRFGESGGTIAADSSPSLNGGVYTGGVTLGQPGGILGDSNTAMTLDGSTGYFSSGQSEPSPSVFSAEAWFKTTTTSGGKIIGFGNNQTGDSSNYDKHIYMTNSGQLIFGTYNGGTDIIQTTKSYNDGQWHQVVGTQGPSGMSLYVDGVKVGSNPTTTNQTYNGFWRVGEDNLNGWPSQPSSNYFGGSIDEASVYNTALTPQQVAAQYTAAGYTLPTLPGSNTPYAKTVIADGPSLYWRLDETSGNTANDLSGNADNGLYNTGDTLGVPGAINDGSSPADTAISTDGNDDGVMVSTSQTPSPSTFSIEAWFKTTNPNGKIIGFGNSSSPTGSGNYDKHIYFNNGVLNFGVWNNEEDVVSAPASPNLADGQWHHVVATQDSSGMKLYVDGNLVASNGVTTNQSYNGYWHVGGDSGWGSVQDYQGSVDEVAIYPYALSAAQVLNDYQIGTGQSTTPTPPPAPGAPTVSSSSPTTAHVAWSTVAGASSYKVLRSVSGANNFAYVATGVTGTSFDDSGLTPGGSYDYEVVASNAGGDSPPSGLTTITTVPAQPGTLTASTNGTSEIDLSWGAATGATSYDVWRSPSGANTFTDQATVNGTTYSDTGLNPGDAYDYEVIPSDSAGPGATSNIASATTLPAKVTGLNPNAVSSTEIDLTWNTATGASTYVVQRAPHGSSNWTTISSGSSATSYNDTGLNPGTTYDYQVAAVDNGGTGAFSDTQSATTNQVPPGQVTGVHANAVSPTEIDLTWGATPGATAYEVDRSTVSGTSGFSPVATGLSSPSYNDIGLSPNTPYWYQVIASNSAGPGPASTAASATTPALNPAVLANSFEGGTSGTAITAANSGGGSGNKFDSVSCTGGTATYSTNSAHGTLAAALTPGTSPCYLQWGKTSITSTSTTSYGRSYLYLAANPAVTEEFAHLGDSSFNRDAQINISTAGKITLYDANNTKQATFTQSLPLNTWLRVEWTLVNSTTSGSLTVSVYSGDSTTPIESHTVSGINTGTAFGSLQIGQVLSSSTAPGTIRLDDVAFGTTGPLGPGT